MKTQGVEVGRGWARPDYFYDGRIIAPLCYAPPFAR